MTAKAPTTSWLWRAGEGMNGLTLNVGERTLEWYDSIGCACGDSTAEQSTEEFRKKGPYLGLPEDIRAELETTLTTLGWS